MLGKGQEGEQGKRNIDLAKEPANVKTEPCGNEEVDIVTWAVRS